MKKIFTFLFCSGLGLTGFSQTPSISAFLTNPLNNPTYTITNGGTVNQITTASAADVSFKVLLKNTSATTHTYTVHRSIVFNAPTMDVSGANAPAPYTYFCFGASCFPDNVNTPPTSSDYTILGPAGSTSAPYDNNYQNSQQFYIYITEAAAQGKYFIRYKLQNVTNSNDTLSFTVKYNEDLPVNELSQAIESVDVYPNPSSSNAFVSVDMKAENDVRIQVYNSLGSIIYTAPVQKYAAGKHKLSIDCSNYNTGLYFISVTAGENKITKRFLLNK
ncbi:MAG: T9SS type A sorting domain-containing protein [Bacteroidia bacterium]